MYTVCGAGHCGGQWAVEVGWIVKCYALISGQLELVG